MLNFNTNLSAFIAQRSFENSTNILNQAIERMSTGLKINGAKDNAANYAITEQMTTQISSLDVAEDNAASGIDLVTTANEQLDIINDRFTRLRDLAIQAENKTYGEESLKAINAECNALVDEIKRIYKSAEYNGIKIYGSEMFETIPTGGTQTLGADPQPVTSTTTADVNTTLEELGIDYSEFQIYNSSGEIIESYDTEKKDTLGDIFAVLNNYGFTSSITDGVVSISSTNGRYVDGDLMNKLGITLSSEDFISSTEQSSTAKVYYTTTQTATEASTLADLGVLTSGTDTVQVKNKYGDNVASIEVNSNTTMGGLFNSLGNYGIQGSIDEGIISLASSDGNYVQSTGIIASLGIGTAQSSSLVTTGTTQTSADVVTYESVTVTGGEVTTIQEERTTTIWTTTTTSETHTNTIWTTETTSEVRTETVWTTTTTSSTVTETIWTTTTTSTTVTETIWTTTTTSETQTNTITVTGTQSTTKTGTLYVPGTTTTSTANGFIKPVAQIDTSGLVSLSTKSSSTSLTDGTYKISTTAELEQFATMVKASRISEKDVFILANDLDVSTIANFNACNRATFKGVFDGNGYVIKNLTVSLFGTVSGTVKNLGVENYSASGDYKYSVTGNYTSIAANTNDILVNTLTSTGTISNCYSTGEFDSSDVTRYTNISGLVGVNQGVIESCYSDVDFACNTENTNVRVGGLVNENKGGTIRNSYCSSNITNYREAGGVIYRVTTSGGGIENCYFNGTITGCSWRHGLWWRAAGDTSVTINTKNSYSTIDGNQGWDVSSDWNGVQYTHSLNMPALGVVATANTKLSDLGFIEDVKFIFSGKTNWITGTSSIIKSINSASNLTIEIDKNATLAQLESCLETFGKSFNNKITYFDVSFSNGVLTIKSPMDGKILSSTAPNFLAGVSSSSTYTTETKTNTTTTTVTTTTTTSTTQTSTLWDTTTTSTTQTNTIWETTTTSTTETQTVNVTTSTSTTETETISVTTTSSSTQTEMVDVLVTANAEYTTSNISMTAGTTFSTLGLTSRAYITVMNDSTRTIITVKTADTVSSLITKLNNAGATTTLADGKLTITPSSKSIYISGMSDNLLDKLAFEGDFYQTSLGVDMTDSNAMIYDGATTIKQNTTLSEIGVTSGVLTVQKDGEDYATIAVSENQSINEFINELKSAGFNAKCSNGAIEITSEGDMKIVDSDANASNALSVLALQNVLQTVDSTYSNNDSSQLYMLSEIVNTVWQATGAVKLQIGSGVDENSQLEINTGFTMRDLDKLTSIGKNTVNKINYIEEIDSILSEVSSKQTELGAFINRLESALEEINIRYDNLVSARSTLRDADIAEESAIYIQQQILQQASATLLSVTNMNPQLALQLL